MAWLMLTSTCIYFILNFSINVSADITENLFGYPDLNVAMRKIEELHTIVRKQGKQILMLEQKTIESRNTARKQNDCIAQLEARIQELETGAQTQEDTIEISRKESSSESQGIFLTPLIKRDRLPRPVPTADNTAVVAFFALLSSDLTASDPHRIIAFDEEITNVGNAYHPHSGTFIAPRSGVYVFTWTIRVNGPSFYTTELLVNNRVVNCVYYSPQSHVDGSVSSTSVVYMNENDDSVLRTGLRYHTSVIKSDLDGKSSFSGWILM